MVGWLGKSACLALRNVAAVVAAFAGRRCNNAVVHGRTSKADLGPVTSIALGQAANHGNMRRRFSFRGRAVVAGVAGAGSNPVGR